MRLVMKTFLLRLMAVGFVTALASAGTVFFVVDVSIRGVETAVKVTNERVGSLENRLDTGLAELNRTLQSLEETLGGRLSTGDTERASLNQRLRDVCANERALVIEVASATRVQSEIAAALADGELTVSDQLVGSAAVSREILATLERLVQEISANCR